MAPDDTTVEDDFEGRHVKLTFDDAFPLFDAYDPSAGETGGGTDEAPGKSGHARGHRGSGPGNSGNLPGHGGTGR